MKKILLLSAPIGSGHKITAQALEEEFLTRENIEVIHGNIFDFLPQWMGNTFLKVYLGLLKCCPAIYGLLYSSGSGSSNNFLWLRNCLNKMLLKLGKNYLDDIKPDIVIATHATPLGIMSLYKVKYPNLWLGAVVPDYTIHHWWNCDNVNMYFLGDESLKERLSQGAPVKVFGLPLRAGFEKVSRKNSRIELGYEASEKIILLMGGGDGLLPMENILAGLVASSLENARIICVAGNNDKLKYRLKNKFAQYMNIEIYGFRKDIPQLLSAADAIITKAGAATAAEVLTNEVCYIIYKPLPGQEEGNAHFLVQRHNAKLANSLQELMDIVQGNLEPVVARNLSIEDRKLAAKRICDYILQENM